MGEDDDLNGLNPDETGYSERTDFTTPSKLDNFEDDFSIKGGTGDVAGANWGKSTSNSAGGREKSGNQQNDCDPSKPAWNSGKRMCYDPSDYHDPGHPQFIGYKAGTTGASGGDPNAFYNNLSKERLDQENTDEALRFARNNGYSNDVGDIDEKREKAFGKSFMAGNMYTGGEYRGTGEGIGEDKRLGLHSSDLEFREDARHRNQSTSEITWRALKRAGKGAYYQTLSGVGSMFDFEDYFNRDDEVGNWLSNWADESNAKYQKDNEIYTGKENSMASFAFWAKTGADLTASIGAFALQGLGTGALIGKGLQAVKALARLGKAGNALSKGGKAVAGVAEGTGLSGANIMRADKAIDWAGDGLNAIMLNQAESVMSAAPMYNETYKDAIRRGHSEEYAKQVAAYAAQTVVSTNRINFALNMTSVNKLMKASGIKAAPVGPPKNWKQSLTGVGSEMLQEGGEEFINNQAELAGKLAAEGILNQGDNKAIPEVRMLENSNTTNLGHRILGGLQVIGSAAQVGAGGLGLASGFANLPALIGSTAFVTGMSALTNTAMSDGVKEGKNLITGNLGGVGNGGNNSWNRVDWGEAAMSTFLGAIGGGGQTVVTDGVVKRLGSSSGLLAKIPGIGQVNSWAMGKKKEMRYAEDSKELGPDGKPKYLRGQTQYETEPDIADKDVKYAVGEIADKDIKVSKTVKTAAGDTVMEDAIGTDGAVEMEQVVDEKGVPKTKDKVDTKGVPVKAADGSVIQEPVMITKKRPKIETTVITTKGQEITADIVKKLEAEKVFKEKKGEVRYEKNEDGTLKTAPTGPSATNKEPVYIPATRNKMKNGQPVPIYEKGADGKDRKYSTAELEKVKYEEIVALMEPYKNTIMTENLLNQHASYANSIGLSSDIIEVLTDRNIDTESRDIFIKGVAEQLAALELSKSKVNFTSAEFETEYQKQLTLMTKNSENIPYLLEKQQELAKLDLGRQALLAFETGTKDTLVQMFTDVKKMTAEQASEKGFQTDYKEYAQKQIDKIQILEEAYVEYSGKHGAQVGRALFMNRVSHASMMELADQYSEKYRESLEKRAAEATKKIFNGNQKYQLKIQNLIDQLSDLESEFKVSNDDSNLQVEVDSKKVSVDEAGIAINDDTFTEEYKAKRKEYQKIRDIKVTELDLIKKEFTALEAADVVGNKDQIEILKKKYEKEIDEFVKTHKTPFDDYDSKIKNERAEKLEKVSAQILKLQEDNRKAYEEKKQTLYDNFIEENKDNTDLTSKLSKGEIKSLIAENVDGLSELQKSKQLILQEAKGLNESFNKLRDTNQVNREYNRQQNEKANVRRMLIEIYDRKEELNQNQKDFNNAAEKESEVSSHIGSAVYRGVRYVETTESEEHDGEIVEVKSYKQEYFELTGNFQTTAGKTVFVPNDESPFVVYEEEILEDYQNVVIPGKEGEFLETVEKLEKANKELKSVFEEMRSLKTSKDKLINDRIEIEKKLQEPNADADALNEEVKVVNEKIKDVNSKYVPIIKQKDELKKQQLDLNIIKKELSFYNITKKEDTKGSAAHDGFAIVSQKNYKNIVQIPGSKLTFTSEKIERTRDADDNNVFGQSSGVEKNVSLENGQQADIIKLYVGTSADADTAITKEGQPGGEIVMIRNKNDSKKPGTKKDQTGKQDYAAKKSKEAIELLTAEVLEIIGEINADPANIDNSNKQQRLEDLTAQLKSYSENAGDYIIEMQKPNSIKKKEDLANQIIADNTAKYKENPDKYAYRYASPQINSADGVVAPLFASESVLEESQMMTENQTRWFVSNLFQAKSATSQHVLDMRVAVLKAIDKQYQVLHARAGTDTAKAKLTVDFNALKTALNSGVRTADNTTLAATFATIGFKARKITVTNFTSALFSKKVDKTTSEVGPDAEFADKARKLAGSTEENKRTKQTLAQYHQSIMSYQAISLEESKKEFVKRGVKKMLFDRIQRGKKLAADKIKNYEELSAEMNTIQAVVQSQEGFRESVSDNIQNLIQIARISNYSEEDLVKLGLNQEEAELIYLLANDRELAGIVITSEEDLKAVEKVAGKYTEEYDAAVKEAEDVDANLKKINKEISEGLKTTSDLNAKLKATRAKILKLDKNGLTSPELIEEYKNSQSDANTINEELEKVKARKIELDETVVKLKEATLSSKENIVKLKKKVDKLRQTREKFEKEGGNTKESFISFLQKKSKLIYETIAEFEKLSALQKALQTKASTAAVSNLVLESHTKANASLLKEIQNAATTSSNESDDKETIARKQYEIALKNYKNIGVSTVDEIGAELDELLKIAMAKERTNSSEELLIEVRMLKEQISKMKNASDYQSMLKESIKFYLMLSQANSKEITSGKLKSLSETTVSIYASIDAVLNKQDGPSLSADVADNLFNPKIYLGALANETKDSIANIKDEFKRLDINTASLGVAKAELELVNQAISNVSDNVESYIDPSNTKVTPTGDDEADNIANTRNSVKSQKRFAIKYGQDLQRIHDINIQLAVEKVSDRAQELQDEIARSVNTIIAIKELVSNAFNAYSNLDTLSEEQIKAVYEEYDLRNILEEMAKETRSLNEAKQTYISHKYDMRRAIEYITQRKKKEERKKLNKNLYKDEIFNWSHVLSSDILSYFSGDESANELEILKNKIEDIKAIEAFIVSLGSNTVNSRTEEEFDALTIFNSKSNRGADGRSLGILQEAKSPEFIKAIQDILDLEMEISKLFSDTNPDVQTILDIAKKLGFEMTEEGIIATYSKDENTLNVEAIITDFMIKLQNNAFETIGKSQAELTKDVTESLTKATAEKDKKTYNNKSKAVSAYQIESRLEKSQSIQQMLNEMRDARQVIRQQEMLSRDIFNGEFKDGEAVYPGDAVTEKRNVYVTAMLYPELEDTVKKHSLRLNALSKNIPKLEAAWSEHAQSDQNITTAFKNLGREMPAYDSKFGENVGKLIEDLRSSQVTKPLMDLVTNNLGLLQENFDTLKSLFINKGPDPVNETLLQFIERYSKNETNSSSKLLLKIQEILGTPHDKFTVSESDKELVKKIGESITSLLTVRENRESSYDLWKKKTELTPAKFMENDKALSSEKMLELALEIVSSIPATKALKTNEYVFTRFVINKKLNTLNKALTTIRKNISDAYLIEIPALITKIETSTKIIETETEKAKIIEDYLKKVKADGKKPAKIGEAEEAVLALVNNPIVRYSLKKAIENETDPIAYLTKVTELFESELKKHADQASEETKKRSDLESQKTKIEKKARNSENSSFIKQAQELEKALEKLDKPLLEIRDKMAKATQTQIKAQVDLMEKYNKIASVAAEVSYNEQKPENFEAEYAEMLHITRTTKEDILTTSNSGNQIFKANEIRWQKFLHEIMASTSAGISMRYVSFGGTNIDSIDNLTLALSNETEEQDNKTSKTLSEIDDAYSKAGKQRNVYAVPAKKEKIGDKEVTLYATIDNAGVIYWEEESNLDSLPKDRNIIYTNFSGEAAVARTGYNTFKKSFLSKDDIQVTVQGSKSLYPVSALDNRIKGVVGLLSNDNLNSSKDYIKSKYVYDSPSFFGGTTKVTVDGLEVDPLFLYWLCEKSNAALFENSDDYNKILESSEIWKRLEEVNENNPKWKDGGKAIMLMRFRNSYVTYKKFKRDFLETTENFRNQVLNSQVPMFGLIENIKMGSLKRNTAVTLAPVKLIFDRDAFMNRATVHIAGTVDFTVQFEEKFTGLPIIRMNGMHVETYATSLTDSDIVTSMNLFYQGISKAKDKEGKKNTFDFPVYEADGTKTSDIHNGNILGRGPDGSYALLHTLVRFTKPAKENGDGIIPNVTLFFESTGGLQFAINENGKNKLLTLGKSDLERIGKVENEAALEALYLDSKRNNTNLHKFIEFMRNKRQHILNVTERKNADSTVYYHPFKTDDGKIGVKKYESYKAFLYDTGRLKLNVTKHNIQALQSYPTATAYAVLSPDLSDKILNSAELIKENERRNSERKEKQRVEAFRIRVTQHQELEDKTIVSSNTAHLDELKTALASVSNELKSREITDLEKASLKGLQDKLEAKIEEYEEKVKADQLEYAKQQAENKNKGKTPPTTSPAPAPGTPYVDPNPGVKTDLEAGIEVDTSTGKKVVKLTPTFEENLEDYVGKTNPDGRKGLLMRGLFKNNNNRNGSDVFSNNTLLYKVGTELKGLLADLRIVTSSPNGGILVFNKVLADEFLEMLKKGDINITIQNAFKKVFDNVSQAGDNDESISALAHKMNTVFLEILFSKQNVLDKLKIQEFDLVTSEQDLYFKIAIPTPILKDDLKIVNLAFLKGLNIVDADGKITKEVETILIANGFSKTNIDTINPALETSKNHSIMSIDSDLFNILAKNNFFGDSTIGDIRTEYFTNLTKHYNPDLKEDEIKTRILKFNNANKYFIDATSFSAKGKTTEEAGIILMLREEASAVNTRNTATKADTLSNKILAAKTTDKDAVGQIIVQHFGKHTDAGKAVAQLIGTIDNSVQIGVSNIAPNHSFKNDAKTPKVTISGSLDTGTVDNILVKDILHELIHANIKGDKTVTRQIYQVAKKFVEEVLTVDLLEEIAQTKEGRINFFASLKILGKDKEIKQIFSNLQTSGFENETALEEAVKAIKVMYAESDGNSEEFLAYTMNSKSFANILNNHDYEKGKSFLKHLLEVIKDYVKNVLGLDVKEGTYLAKLFEVAPFLNDPGAQVEEEVVLPPPAPYSNTTSNATQTTPNRGFSPGIVVINPSVAPKNNKGVVAFSEKPTKGGFLSILIGTKEFNSLEGEFTMNVENIESIKSLLKTRSIYSSTVSIAGPLVLNFVGNNELIKNWKITPGKIKRKDINSPWEVISEIEVKFVENAPINVAPVNVAPQAQNVQPTTTRDNTPSDNLSNANIRTYSVPAGNSTGKVAINKSSISEVFKKPKNKNDASNYPLIIGKDFENSTTAKFTIDTSDFQIAKRFFELAPNWLGSVDVPGAFIDAYMKDSNAIKDWKIIPGELERNNSDSGWNVVKQIKIIPREIPVVQQQAPTVQTVEVKDFAYFSKKIQNATTKDELRSIQKETEYAALTTEDSSIETELRQKSVALKAIGNSINLNFNTLDNNTEDTQYEEQFTEDITGTDELEESLEEEVVIDKDAEKEARKERKRLARIEKEELRDKIYSLDNTIKMKYADKTLEIEASSMAHLLEGVTVLFMRKLRNNNIGQNRVNPDLSLIFNPAKLFSDTNVSITTFYDDLFFDLASDYSDEFDKSDLQDVLTALSGVSPEAVKIKKEILARFKKEIKKYKIELNEEFDEYSTETSKDPIQDRLHYLTSAYDMTDISIKILLNGLPELQVINGNIVPKLNISGFPKLIDGPKLFNLLHNLLNDKPVGKSDIVTELQNIYRGIIQTPAEYMNENDLLLLSLHEVFAANGNVNLLRVVGGENGRLDARDLQNVALITEFMQSFTKTQPNFTTATVQGSQIVISNAATVYSETNILNKWRDDITNFQKLSSSYSKQLEKLLETKIAVDAETNENFDNYEDVKKFWKGLGINISNKLGYKEYEEAYKSLKEDANVLGLAQDTKSFIEHLQLLVKDLKPKEREEFLQNFNVVDFMNSAEDSSAFANTVRRLSKLESSLKKSQESKKFQTADGNDIHGVNLHCEATIIAADLNNAATLEEAKQLLPQLRSTYATNSYILSKLFDSKGNRIKNVNIKFGYSSGVTEESEGIIIANLKANDKFILDLSSIMRDGGKKPLFPFLRSADRGSEMTVQLEDDNGYPLPALTISNTVTSNDLYLKYLEDEMNTIRQYNSNKNSKRISNYSKKDRGGNKFRLFDSYGKSDIGLLGTEAETKDLINFAKNAGTLEEIKTEIAKRKEELKTSFNNYIKARTTDMLEWLRNNDFIDNDFKLPLTEYKDESNPGKVTEMVSYFIRNSIIGYAEQTKLVTGDPMFYKSSGDAFKRFKMFNATKKLSLMRTNVREMFNNDLRVSYNYEGGSFDFKLSKDEEQYQKDIKIARVLDKAMYNIDSLTTEDMIVISNNNPAIYTEISNARGKQAKPEFSPAWKADGRWTDKFNTIVISDVEFASTELGSWTTETVTDALGNKSKKTVKLSDLSVKVGPEKEPIFIIKGRVANDNEVGDMVKEFTKTFIKNGIVNEQLLTAKLQSFVKPYMEINEADAEAYCTLPFYKQLLLNSGKQWTEQLEKSYQKAIQGKDLDISDYENLEIEGGFKGAFTKLKTQATGPLDSWTELNADGEIVAFQNYNTPEYDGKGEVPIAGYKHSLIPLLPGLIKDTPLEGLNRRLIDSGVQLAQFISGVKYGAIGTGVEGSESDNHDFYSEESTNQSTFSKGNLVYQTMNLKHIGIQVDMRASFKEKVTAGTQFRKLLVNGMFEKGIPSDFRNLPANLLKTEKQLTESWDNLSDKAKREKSEMWRTSEEYAKVQGLIYEAHFEKLKKEFGITMENGNLKVTEKEKFVKALIDAMEQEGKSINDILSVKYLEKAENPIEILATSKNFMYMVYALVNNRVIKEKRHGEGAPQGAITGWENTVKNGGFDRQGTDSFLKSYRYNKDKSKILPSECIIALPEALNALVSQPRIGGLDKFNQMIKQLYAKIDKADEDKTKLELTDEEKQIIKITTLVGFRIPNQGLSSSDILRIVEFKPTMFGTTILVPSNMTAKAGSDFDIDKLTLYSTNFKTNKNKETGEVSLEVQEYVEDGQNSIDALQNKMIELHESIMLHNTKLHQLLSPVSDALFKDKSIGVVWDIRFLSANRNNEHVQNYKNELKVLLEENLSKSELKSRRSEIYYKHKQLFAKQYENEVEGGASMNEIFVPLKNLQMFMAFLSGKTGVGIAAIQNTFNVLSQRANLGIPRSSANFIFDHNIDGDSDPTMGGLTSVDGESISETISAFINAYVDVAKDPFVFEINAGLYTSGTMFNIMRFGAPPTWTIRFLNQPLIKDFVKKIDSAESLSSKEKNEGNKLNENNVYQSLVAAYRNNIFGSNYDFGSRSNIISLAPFYDMKVSLTELYALSGQEGILASFAPGVSETDMREHWLKLNAETLFNQIKNKFGKTGEIAPGSGLISEEELELMLLETDKVSITYKLNTETNTFRKQFNLQAEDKLLMEKQFMMLNMFMYYKWQGDKMRELADLSNYDTNGLQKTNGANREKIGRVIDLLSGANKTKEVKNKLYKNGHKLVEGSMVEKTETIAQQYFQAMVSMSAFYNPDVNPKLYKAIKSFQDDILLNFPTLKNKDKYMAFTTNMEADFVTYLVLSKEGFKPGVVFDKLFAYGKDSKYKAYNGSPVSLVKFTNDLATIADIFVNNYNKNGIFGDETIADTKFLTEVLEKIGGSYTTENVIKLQKFMTIKENRTLINHFAQTNAFRKMKYKTAENSSIRTWDNMSKKKSLIEERNKSQVDYFNANLNRVEIETLNQYVTEMNALKKLNPDFYMDILAFSINQSGLRDNRIHSMIKIFDAKEITELKLEFLTNQSDEILAKAFHKFVEQIVMQDKALFKKVRSYTDRDNNSYKSVPVSKGKIVLAGASRTIEDKNKKSFKLELLSSDKDATPQTIHGVPNHFFGIAATGIKPSIKKSLEEKREEWFEKVEKC